MIGLFQYRHGALRPADAHTIEMCGRFKQGEIVKAEPKRMRNPKQLGLWFALAGVLAEHADWCKTKKQASGWLKITIGHFDVVRSPDGKEWAEPKSIAYGNCEQTEFDQLLTAAIGVVCEKIIPGTSNEILRAELEAMVMPVGPPDSKALLAAQLALSVELGKQGDGTIYDWDIVAADIVDLIVIARDFDRLEEIDAVYETELAEMEKHAPDHYRRVTEAMEQKGEELNRKDSAADSAQPARHTVEAG